MLKFRMSLPYLAFVAFCWAIPTATLCLLDNGNHINFTVVLKTYLMFIVGGFCFALITYPFIKMERTKREPNIDFFLSKPSCVRMYVVLKKLLLSRCFWVGIFCTIATIFLFCEIVEKKLPPITAIGIRYSLTILIAFLTKDFLTVVNKLLKLGEKLNTKYSTSNARAFCVWLYFAYFIGALVLGLGLGTVELVLTKFVCNFPFKFVELSVVENICRLYGKNMTYGFVLGTIGFLCQYKKTREV